MPRKNTIFIADDHPVLRDGIKAIFRARPEFDVVGESDNGQEALSAISTLKPDIAIMDITMPQLDGIAATRRISNECPGTKVMILSMHAEVYSAIEAFRAGALGYVLKDTPPDELVKAVDKVLSGGKYISPAVADGLIDGFVDVMKRDSAVEPYDTLSAREKDVFKLLAEGVAVREIAERLFISVSTVKTHRNKIMKKLSIKDIPTLVKYAIKKGVVTA